MKTRLMVVAALCLGLAGSLAGCGPKPAKLEPLTVQLSVYPQGTNTYLFLAEQKGWFKDAGLDVQVLDGRGSNYSMQVLTSGHADIGEGSFTPLVFARQRGAKAVAIAEFYPLLGPAVIGARDAGVLTPADLKGKKVAVASAGPWPPLLSPFLDRFGLKQTDLKLMYVDLNTLFSTYVSKQADAILSVDTAITETGPRRDSVLMRASDFGVQLPGAGLFATEQELAGPKAEAIKRFLAVCAKALQYQYDGHEDEAAKALIALRPNAKLKEEALLSQIDLYRPQFTQWKQTGAQPGRMDPDKWSGEIAYMKSVGMLKGDLKASEMFTNAYLPEPGK